MASLPSPASWRRRSSPAEQTASSSAPETTENPQNTSSDSEAILINSPRNAESSATKSEEQDSAPKTPTEQPRTCWICQMDDTEDTPETSEWRTPCPCSLTAHDSCLLEWIASEEAPQPGDIARNRQLKCPQCQAEIKIQRPKDYLVAVVELVQRLVRFAIIPSALTGLVGCVYSGLLVHGFNSMQLVFGVDETAAILSRSLRDRTYYDAPLYAGSEVIGALTRYLSPFFPTSKFFQGDNFTFFIGLPLIGPSLILLRSKFGDKAFAWTLPIVSKFTISLGGFDMLTQLVSPRQIPPICRVASIS